MSVPTIGHMAVHITLQRKADRSLYDAHMLGLWEGAWGHEPAVLDVDDQRLQQVYDAGWLTGAEEREAWGDLAWCPSWTATRPPDLERGQ